jgi:hypothetical protein
MISPTTNWGKFKDIRMGNQGKGEDKEDNLKGMKVKLNRNLNLLSRPFETTLNSLVTVSRWSIPRPTYKWSRNGPIHDRKCPGSGPPPIPANIGLVP